MNGADASRPADGSTTATGGTLLGVDVSQDRRARATIAVFLAGPIIWSAHFLLVYAIAEAGCTGDGPGLRLFDPPVPTIATLLATAVAAIACLWCAWLAYRRWRARQRGGDPEGLDPGGALAFGGFLLSLLSFVSILFAGLPALYLAC